MSSVDCQIRSKLDNWGGGAHVHIFVFYIFRFFLNRWFFEVCEHEYMNMSTPPRPPIIEHATARRPRVFVDSFTPWHQENAAKLPCPECTNLIVRVRVRFNFKFVYSGQVWVLYFKFNLWHWQIAGKRVVPLTEFFIQ